MLNRLRVIFGQINDSGLGFFEGMANGALEEFASWAYDCAVDLVSFHAANKSQI